MVGDGEPRQRDNPKADETKRVVNLEFLIPRRPLSLQAKRTSLRAWQAFVRKEEAKVWKDPTVQTGDLHLTWYIYATFLLLILTTS
jgi:hypothetical protein